MCRQCGSEKRQSRSNIASIAALRRAGSRSPKTPCRLRTSRVSILSDMRSSSLLRSNLRLTAIGEQLDAGDETGLVGREEQRCAGDLLRIRDPAVRHFRGEMIEQALLRRPVVTGKAEQTRRLGCTGAQDIDP